jgi:hypothetical protein
MKISGREEWSRVSEGGSKPRAAGGIKQKQGRNKLVSESTSQVTCLLSHHREAFAPQSPQPTLQSLGNRFELHIVDPSHTTDFIIEFQ